MTAGVRLVTAGAVGKPHGLDGSFNAERATHPLAVGTVVRIGGEPHVVERRAGTDSRPLLRLAGIADREAAAALRGELLLVEDTLADGEWLAEDLVGCSVEGLGAVKRVMDGPSCDVLELDDGRLVPLISDAVRRVDLERRTIEIDPRFLGVEPEASE
jgi:16S rRNA processing protein RimM